MVVRAFRRLVLILLVALGASASCGKDDDDPPRNTPVEAFVTDPVGTQKVEVSLLYDLVDPDFDLATVLVEFSTDDGVSFGPFPATEHTGPGSPSSGIMDLLTGPSPGTTHTFVWDTLADLGPTLQSLVRLRVTPSDAVPGVSATTGTFVVDNAAKPPPWVEITPLPSPQSRDVRVIYTLFDLRRYPVAITVEYSLTGGPPYLPATEAPVPFSDGTTDLVTAPPPPGRLHTFVWDTMADGVGFSATPDVALIRITPHDISQTGVPVDSNPFDVSNFGNIAPSVTIDPVTPDPWPTGDVTIDYHLIDPDGDRAFIVVEYSTDSGATYAPATEGSGSPGTTDLPTGPSPGMAYWFVWETLSDVGATIEPQCRVRIIPSDGTVGTPAESGDFLVENDDSTPPEVAGISDSVTNTQQQRIVIDFSEPLDATSLILGTSGPATIGVVEDNDTVPGGDPCIGLGPASDFSEVPGQIILGLQNSRVIFYPDAAFKEGREVRLVLTSGIRDIAANPLVQDAVSPPVPTDPLSLDCLISPQVFEDRFIPGATPPCTRFLPDPDSDVWHYDFDTFQTFDMDLANRGLQTPNGADPENLAARERVIAEVLSTLSAKYYRDPGDGSAISGAWKISFVCSAPPGGTLGVDYSRMCVGLDLLAQGILGRAWLDPGNGGKEDDCQLTGPTLGVFSGGINGTNSTLLPGLAAGDLPYLDGTYTLGSGTASEDARFLEILGVIDDWAHALGTVGAHETGHSVGLQHDDGSSLNIMRSAASQAFLSNGNTRFSAANAAILDTNLGVVP